MADGYGAPGWQTDELLEEWVSEHGSPQPPSPNERLATLSIGRGSQEPPTPTRSSSANNSMKSLVEEATSPEAGGTFLIRQDQPLPETPLGLRPGQMLKKGGMKTFFTPLALERMFDPPSPPHSAEPPDAESTPVNHESPHRQLSPLPKPAFMSVNSLPKPSKLSKSFLPAEWEQSTDGGSIVLDDDEESAGERSDEILASDIPGIMAFNGRKPSTNFKFTFTITPNQSLSHVAGQRISPPNPSPNPRAHGAKHPSPIDVGIANQDEAPPAMLSAVDPQLRLFQFQYDTYTRDHLNALVDSLAVKSPPAWGQASPTTASDGDGPVWRSSKRLRLSPPEDYTSRNSTVSAAFRASPWGKNQSRDYFRGSPSLARRMGNGRGTRTASRETSDSEEDDDQSHETHSDSDTEQEKLQSIDQQLGVPLTSSTASARTSTTSSATATVPDNSPPEEEEIPKRPSVNYRLQGANILAQIRSDMQTRGRNVSWSTASEQSVASVRGELPSFVEAEKERSRQSIFADETVDQHHSLPPVEEVTEETTSRSISMRVKKISPRKLLRRLSAADEVDRELADMSLVSSSEASMVVRSPEKSLDKRKADHLTFNPSQFVAAPTVVFSAHAVATNVPPPPYIGIAQATPAISSNPLPSHRRQPSSPSGSLHPNHQQAIPSTNPNQDDLNRFVSSSTASGGSATTAGSFVKHAGPPTVQMRTIYPKELEGILPERVNGMVFSKVHSKWVKEGEPAGGEADRSEDPFGDIESLREEAVSAPTLAPEATENAGGDVSLRLNGGDTSRLDVSAKDGALVADPEPSLETDNQTYREEATESESEDDEALPPPVTDTSIRFDDTLQFTTDDDTELQPPRPARAPSVQVSASESVAADLSIDVASLSLREPTNADAEDPHPPVLSSVSTPSAIRQTQKPALPRSALKTTASTPYRSRNSTPYAIGAASAGATPYASGGANRRSVSFSDGRKSGKIRGLADGGHADTTEEDGSQNTSSSTSETSSNVLPADLSSFVPSARTKRITEALDALDDSDEPDTFATQPRNGKQPVPFPPPTGSSRADLSFAPGAHHGQAITPDRDDWQDERASMPDTSESLSLSGGPAHRSFSRTQKKGSGEMTFLTEASFRVTHDQLVRILTTVEPYEPCWEQLRTVDLANKHVDSLARLKEVLPNLDKLVLDANQLAWLSGLPSTIRTLSASHNLLTSLTSYIHLPNIENLDVSSNRIDSLQQLECLRHLRELKADNNNIVNIDGLAKLDGLVKVSLKGNRLKGELDLAGFTWPRVEVLNLAQNELRSVTGLGARTVPGLVTLDLDSNSLRTFTSDGLLLKLRVLRLSDNKLVRLDVRSFPSLRTLYADNNRLGELVNADKLSRLENLSLRYQTGRLLVSTRDVRDVKRLYLSGNSLDSAQLFQEPCYNVVYLELASCGLTQLPEDLARLAPNLRVLNLNYNFLTDVRPLDGLVRVRKLMCVGSRIKGSKQVVKVLQKMPELEVVDFRMNPFTLGWYIPVIVNDLQGALQPPEANRYATHDDADDDPSPLNTASTILPPRKRRGGVPTLEELDARFRADLPDELYLARLGFRALVMHGCKKLGSLDGLMIGEPEREKARKLLKGLNESKSVVVVGQQKQQQQYHQPQQHTARAKAKADGGASSEQKVNERASKPGVGHPVGKKLGEGGR